MDYRLITFGYATYMPIKGKISTSPSKGIAGRADHREEYDEEETGIDKC